MGGKIIACHVHNVVVVATAIAWLVDGRRRAEANKETKRDMIEGMTETFQTEKTGGLAGS